jgi:hypothetical protein
MKKKEVAWQGAVKCCSLEILLFQQSNIKTKTKTPWSESASELYRPSDRRLSAK